jgi:predicted SAM-dependent methyltransferase
MKYLNLGCGNHYHPEWTNVDIASTEEGVIACNLTQGIPFPTASFDVVYHSHVLEHIPKTEAEFFLKECSRVLRPGGILRVVVPDLEQITRTYLFALEQASAGSQEWAANYEWVLIEMYDMTVRNDSGGQMAEYLSRETIPSEFIKKQSGAALLEWRQALRQSISVQEHQSRQPTLIQRIHHFLHHAGNRRERLIRNFREPLLKLLLGQKDYRALQIGRLRQSGELHQWMYDHYSLSLLLEKCGLGNIVQRSPTESYIKNWTDFHLDTEPDGTVYKPGSLYLEAIQPSV